MDREELLQQVEAWETKSASKEEFDAAAERAKPLTDLSNDQKLVLYGLFKQATVGDVNTSRPWGIDMVGCAKWYYYLKFIIFFHFLTLLFSGMLGNLIREFLKKRLPCATFTMLMSF